MNSNGIIFCSECGFQNKIGDHVCTNCGRFLESSQVNNSIDVNKNNNDYVPTILGITSLVLYFFGAGIFETIALFLPESIRPFVSSLGGISSLAGIVVMIIGRIKYPQNKFLKVVMWIIIGILIFGIVAMILLFLWCAITYQTQDWSNCG